MLIYVTVSIKRSSFMKNITVGSMTRGKLEAVKFHQTFRKHTFLYKLFH